MNSIKIPLPGFSSYNSKILNTHIMYGLVESLLRGWVQSINVFPQGEGYLVETDTDFDWHHIFKGMRSALRDMISFHYSLGHQVGIKIKTKKGKKTKRVTISDVSFCGGIFLDPPQNIQRYPRELQAILEYLDNANIYSEKKTLEDMRSTKSFIDAKPLNVLEQFDPTVGKWIGFYTYEEGGMLSRLEYALTWIGIHYYSTISKILRKSDQWVIITQYPPLESVETWELLLIRDLATKVVNVANNAERYWKVGIEYGLLRKLIDTHLLPTIEDIPGLSKFGIILYAQERSKSKGWRIFKQMELPRLWDFVSYLKIHALYDLAKLIRIFNGLENSKDNEKAITNITNVLAQFGRGMYSAVVFGEVNDLYSAIRGLRRLGYSVPPGLMSAIIEYVFGDEV